MQIFMRSTLLTLVLIFIFGILYPISIWIVGRIDINNSNGLPIFKNGQVIGFKNIGQNFSSTKYFHGRPSAVDYNSASSGGSNLSITNPLFIEQVKERIAKLLSENPTINKSQIPFELVTSSGSGIDPHISLESALLQVDRIAKNRNINTDKIKQLIESCVEYPYFNLISKKCINVLNLNIKLDELEELLSKEHIILKPKISFEFLTSCGSHDYPRISFECALKQVDDIANSRSIDKNTLIQMVEKSVEYPFRSVAFKKDVNVLDLNSKLQELEENINQNGK